MFKKGNKLNRLSVEELEQILKIKQRDARRERFLRLSAEGAPPDAALLRAQDSAALPTGATPSTASNAGLMQTPQLYPLKGHTAAPRPKPKGWRDRVLALVEVGALAGLVAVLIVSYLNLQTLNQEVVATRLQNRFIPASPGEPAFSPPAGQAEPAVNFDRLPGGHSSPTSEGGAVPDIPAHLQNWVQPAPAVPAPKQSAAIATRIVIPKINVDAPIIQGVTWEDLKQGVGHLPGSAQPGERGNLYLAAHNDIFGEIFRYLEKLEPGDEYLIYAGQTRYRYVVREKRIIEPTEVSVMLPTTSPVATLQTCYPYLIDTHRLVVVGDLVE